MRRNLRRDCRAGFGRIWQSGAATRKWVLAGAVDQPAYSIGAIAAEQLMKMRSTESADAALQNRSKI